MRIDMILDISDLIYKDIMEKENFYIPIRWGMIFLPQYIGQVEKMSKQQ